MIYMLSISVHYYMIYIYNITIYDKREIVYERSGKNKITIKTHCFYRVITVVSVRYCVTRLFYSSKTIIVLTP